MIEMPDKRDIPAYAVGPRVFSPEECARITETLKNLPTKDAETDMKLNIRKGKVSWLRPNWDAVYASRIKRLVENVNEQVFGFNLSGSMETYQFTRYESDGDHYGWHKDLGAGDAGYRKLSFVVQLSDEDTYGGGNLEFYFHRGVDFRAQGKIIFFPSFEVHRVTPIEWGKRYSLVGWISGGSFR